MDSVNDKLLDESVKHALVLERFKKGEARRIAKYLRDTVWPDILARLPTVRRKRTMLQIIKLIKATDLGLFDSMQTFVQAESQWALATLEQTVPLNAVSFVAPGAATLKAVVDETPILGKTVTEWTESYSSAVADSVRRQIRIGVVEGESVDEMSRRLMNILPVATRNAQSVVRTAVTHISTASREAVYQANDKIVKAVELVATLDSRTTVICMGYDGKVYPVGIGPRPPFHWNCRTVTVPVTRSWKELGVRLKNEVPKGSRASMNGQVPASTSYGEWIKKQPIDVQDMALGPRRAAMLRTGALTVEDFTDAYGTPLTIDQIMSRAPIAAAAGGRTELRDSVVSMLLSDENNGSRLRSRGWRAGGKSDISIEFSKPAINDGVRVVTWKPEGATFGLPLRATKWEGSLVKYATDYADKFTDIETLLARRVRYDGNGLLVRALEGRLKNLGWVHAMPYDNSSLDEALTIARKLTDVGLIPGTLEHAKRRLAGALSESSKYYWAKKVRDLEARLVFGISTADLEKIRQILLKKYSPAKVDALIAQSKSVEELLDS